MNANLERWQKTLESKSFEISRTKTKYMVCNFSGYIERVETTIRIEDHEIPQSDSFHHLGSITSKDGEIDEDVEHRIKAGWVNAL